MVGPQRAVSLVLAFLVCASLAASAEPPAGRGTTGPLPDDLSFVAGSSDDTARTAVARPGEGQPLAEVSAWFTTDPAWDFVNRVGFVRRLQTGWRYAVQFDVSAGALVELVPTDSLTVKARQAVARAPSWFQKELEDQFSRMSSTAQQDRWADEVLNATDPYVDETAFLVAHVSKDDLQNANFYAQLIQESAHYAYEVDPFLDYVRVVDHGSAAEGGDYDSVLAYRVELDGVVTEVEYPRELYYWWVLSPRGSDEFPTYINPVPCSSGGTPAAPPTGKFWREWLFYGATNKYGKCDTDWDGSHDDTCPILKDSLAGVSTLWSHLGNTSGPSNGAVGVVNEWIRRSLGPFGDVDGCRPVQPVNVYYHADGNCGEWADLTMAAGRAALIPTEVTGTQANDHVWNEFFDAQWGRWVQWEPVNNMIDSNYSGWWGGKIAATHTYRGDGYGHTERTSQHGPSATLEVTVYDANHYPVDGALVVLSTPYDPLPIVLMSCSQGHTNASGKIKFVLGDGRDYHVYVSTAWGRYPASGSTKVITSAVGGTAYAWSPPNFAGSVPRLSISADSSPGTLDDYLLESEWTVAEGLVHGASLVSSSLTYTKDHPGDVDAFVADETGWNQFIANQPFSAYSVSIDASSGAASFIPPEPVDYFVAWSNKASMDMVHVVSGEVRLYRNNGSVPPVRALTVDKNVALSSMLDWEDVVGQNVDGYNAYRSTSAADVGGARTPSELEPYKIAFVTVSQYTDTATVPPDACFYYSVRTHSRRGGISP